MSAPSAQQLQCELDHNTQLAFLSCLKKYDENTSQIAQLSIPDQVTLQSFSLAELGVLAQIWRELRKDSLIQDEAAGYILLCHRFNRLHGLTDIESAVFDEITLTTSDLGGCTINPATPRVICFIDDEERDKHPYFLVGIDPTGYGPHTAQQNPNSTYNREATIAAGLQPKEMLQVKYARLEKDREGEPTVLSAERLCCSGSDLSVFIQDRQPVDIVYFDWVEFVSQHPDACRYLRFCCLLDHELFGFIPACDFDAARAFRVSGHRLAAPIALSIGGSDLFLHDRPDGAWRGLVGILFCHSGGVDRAVERVRCGREVGKVSRGVSIRCLSRGSWPGSICCSGCS